MALRVARGFCAQVFVALGTAPGGEVLIEIAIARQQREHSTFIEERQRGAHEREQSAAERQIASIDRNHSRGRGHQTFATTSLASAFSRLRYPSSRGGIHSRSPSSSSRRR